jgi:hypothetical protein
MGCRSPAVRLRTGSPPPWPRCLHRPRITASSYPRPRSTCRPALSGWRYPAAGSRFPRAVKCLIPARPSVYARSCAIHAGASGLRGSLPDVRPPGMSHNLSLLIPWLLTNQSAKPDRRSQLLLVVGEPGGPAPVRRRSHWREAAPARIRSACVTLQRKVHCQRGRASTRRQCRHRARPSRLLIGEGS